MNLSVKEIESIKKCFIGKPVKRAFLFGSYTRNEADSDSDVDILVELDYSKHIGLGFATMQLELEKSLKKKVDLVSSNAVYKGIKPFIDNDKQLIYER
ncbi:MAG: nucleotidyltransferase family protein [Bacteroidia bacterium]